MVLLLLTVSKQFRCNSFVVVKGNPEPPGTYPRQSVRQPMDCGGHHATARREREGDKETDIGMTGAAGSVQVVDTEVG